MHRWCIFFTLFLLPRKKLAGIVSFINHSCAPNCRFIRKENSRVEIQVRVDSKVKSHYLSLRLSDGSNLERSWPLNMQILFVPVSPALLLGILSLSHLPVNQPNPPIHPSYLYHHGATSISGILCLSSSTSWIFFDSGSHQSLYQPRHNRLKMC